MTRRPLRLTTVLAASLGFNIGVLPAGQGVNYRVAS
jgi:hypothetical protein